MSERLGMEDPMQEDQNRFWLRRILSYADFEFRVQAWRVFYRVVEALVIIELIGEKRRNVLVIGEGSLTYED